MKRFANGQFKPTKHFKWIGIIYLMFLGWMLFMGSEYTMNLNLGIFKQEYTFISPLVVEEIEDYEMSYEIKEPCNEIDCWIDMYSKQYGTDLNKRQQLKVKLHFLAYREAKYGVSNGHGDGGKAGGPYQFHQPTWEANRQRMIDEGLINDIGSRYDMQQAIQTTAWMLSEGQDNQWGPLLRKEINL